VVEKIAQFPLKERKRARIRLALADSVIKRTQDRSFEKIKIETLCQDAEISRGTFFRFFPKKIDLIFYVTNLWAIETGWQLNHTEGIEPGYKKINEFFRLSALSFERHQHFFIEALSQRVLDPVEFNRQDNEYNRVGLVERLIRFPEYEGIEAIPEGGFSVLFRQNIEAAIKTKNLPKTTDSEESILALACIFYGVPTMISDRTASHLAETYSQQLKIVWKGLGGRI